MPELPEVETAKRGIAPYVEGETIERVIVRQKQLRWEIPAELQNLQQAKVKGIARRAKYLILHTDKGDIIGHLGMSGSVRVVDGDVAPNKHDHVDFKLSSGKILRYNDVRRFGAWLWAQEAENLPLMQKLGLEPLTDEFSAEYLFKQSRQKTSAVKVFLMNNAIVVGVGNIYANETLFLCGLHPKMPAQDLTFKQCEKLVACIKNVLEKAIIQGGTTLKDFRQPDGKPGYFAQELLIYGKKGQPCPTCATLIESLVIGQRNSFFCPHCQKAKNASKTVKKAVKKTEKSL